MKVNESDLDQTAEVESKGYFGRFVAVALVALTVGVVWIFITSDRAA